MDLTLPKQLAALHRMGVPALRQRYAELFGEPTGANNRAWLVKRIAWRLQELAEGGLSERAKRRAAELANDADLRLSPPREKAPAPPAADDRTAVLPFASDNRLPPPGSILTRRYKGEDVQVKVLAEGFEYQGGVFKSLSAVAKAITGSHCNGYLFFRLTSTGDDR